MKKSLVLLLTALVLLSWDATAQSRSARSSRPGRSSATLVRPLGSAERTRLLEKRVSTRVAPAEARLGSSERRALLTGSPTKLYPRRGTRR